MNKHPQISMAILDEVADFTPEQWASINANEDARRRAQFAQRVEEKRKQLDAAADAWLKMWFIGNWK